MACTVCNTNVQPNMKLCGLTRCAIKYEEICVHDVVGIFIKSSPSILKFLWSISRETITKCPERFRPFPTYFIKHKHKDHYTRGKIDDIVNMKIDNNDVEKVKNIFTTNIDDVIALLKDVPLSEDTNVLKVLTSYNINPRMYYLLRFLILSNKTTMISDLYKFDDGSNYNITLYKIVYDDEMETKFDKEITYLYHGSAKYNWHSILRNGIKNCSKTTLKSNGAVYGSGVYLSDSLSFSATYTQGGIMAIIELHGDREKWKKSPNIFVVHDDSILLVRYLLEMPSSYCFPVRKLEKLIDSKLNTYIENRISVNESVKKKRRTRILNELHTFINLYSHVNLKKNDIRLSYKNNTLTIHMKVKKLTILPGAEELIVELAIYLPRIYPFASPIIYIKEPILLHKFITPTGLIYNDKLFGEKWQPTNKLEPLIVNVYNNILVHADLVLQKLYSPGEAMREYNIITRNCQ